MHRQVTRVTNTVTNKVTPGCWWVATCHTLCLCVSQVHSFCFLSHSFFSATFNNKISILGHPATSTAGLDDAGYNKTFPVGGKGGRHDTMNIMFGLNFVRSHFSFNKYCQYNLGQVNIIMPLVQERLLCLSILILFSCNMNPLCSVTFTDFGNSSLFY